MPTRKQWIIIAKCLIAFAVVVGLVLAARKATTQWHDQSQALRDQVAALDLKIASETDDTKHRELISRRDVLQDSIPTLANLDWLKIALAAIIYAIALIPPGFVLNEAVRTFGERASFGRVISAQLLGHLGKYVPGKAMVVVLRVGMLKRAGVSIWPATISVFMETLLMMGVGSATSAVLVCFLPIPNWLLASAVGVAVAATVPTLPPVLKWAATKFAPKGAKDANESNESEAGNVEHDQSSETSQPLVGATRFFIFGWLWSLISWVLIGLSFTLLVSAIPTTEMLPDSVKLYTVSTAAIGLAMVIGFASLLPGGAGIRELVLTILLAPVVGPAHALLSSIAARLMFIAIEVTCAGAAWLSVTRSRESRED